MPIKKPCCTKEEKALAKLAQTIAKTVIPRYKKKAVVKIKPIMKQNDSFTTYNPLGYGIHHIQNKQKLINPYEAASTSALSLSDIMKQFNNNSLPSLEDSFLEQRLKELNKVNYKKPKDDGPDVKELDQRTRSESANENALPVLINKKYSKIAKKAKDIQIEDRETIDYSKLMDDNLKMLKIAPDRPFDMNRYMRNIPHQTPEDLVRNDMQTQTEYDDLGDYEDLIRNDMQTQTEYDDLGDYEDDIDQGTQYDLDDLKKVEDKKEIDKYKIEIVNGKKTVDNRPINVSQLRVEDRDKLLNLYGIIKTKLNKTGKIIKNKTDEELKNDIRYYEQQNVITELQRIKNIID